MVTSEEWGQLTRLPRLVRLAGWIDCVVHPVTLCQQGSLSCLCLLWNTDDILASDQADVVVFPETFLVPSANSCHFVTSRCLFTLPNTGKPSPVSSNSWYEVCMLRIRIPLRLFAIARRLCMLSIPHTPWAPTFAVGQQTSSPQVSSFVEDESDYFPHSLWSSWAMQLCNLDMRASEGLQLLTTRRERGEVYPWDLCLFILTGKVKYITTFTKHCLVNCLWLLLISSSGCYWSIVGDRSCISFCQTSQNNVVKGTSSCTPLKNAAFSVRLHIVCICVYICIWNFYIVAVASGLIGHRTDCNRTWRDERESPREWPREVHCRLRLKIVSVAPSCHPCRRGRQIFWGTSGQTLGGSETKEGWGG